MKAPTNEMAIPTVTQSATVNLSVNSSISKTSAKPIHAASKINDMRES